MIGKRTLALLLPAVLLALGPAALAQQTGEEVQPGPPVDTPPAAEATDKPASSQQTAPRAAPVDRSPSDYRASEKISEDLPVSFPVDI